MPKFLKLKDIIRQVRASRTAADERSIVQNECAKIRSSFRNENNTWRCRNVTKLLYIYILGYPAHFGQLECLKLIASSKFTDKRIGYIGAMLLLDERQDVHLLITNSLRNDLNSQSQYVIGFALCTLGAICSPEMSKGLAGEVAKLLRNTNAYVKKKAALCAFRMVQKVPELVEMFIPATKSILLEKDHGVLISTVALITEMCKKSPDVLNHFKSIASCILNILKDLTMTISNSEYKVFGVKDPFLQVKILKLLRLLGKNDSVISEMLNDVLAYITINTEPNKNVGNTILYETVLSIMGVKSESSLRVLGVNILGRLLLNMDKNTKYIALNTLLPCVQTDYDAVQRHRWAILKCLKEDDILIKKKALELCFALVNANNIFSMTEELLTYWENDPGFNAEYSSYIFITAEMYSPSTRWHIDTMIKVLTLAGNCAINDVVCNFIKRISAASELHAYAVQQLWKHLTGDLTTKQPLVQVSCWCIGEFGDLLNHSGSPNSSSLNISFKEVINFVKKVTIENNMELITKEYSITALMKLCVRFPDFTSTILNFIENFRSNINTEIQQRSVEFSVLFQKFKYLTCSILEKMPSIQEISAEYSYTEGKEGIELSNNLKHEVNNINMDDCLILDFLSGGDQKYESKAVTKEVIKSSDELALLDLLTNIEFDSQIQSFYSPCKHSTLLEQYLTFEPYLENIPSITAFDKNGLKIIFEFELPHTHPQMIVINLEATNYSDSPMYDIIIKAAVPKAFQLQVLPPTNNVLLANNLGKIRQTLKILNPQKMQLRMKLRVSYVSNNQAFEDESEVNNVPKTLHLYLD